MIIYIVSRGELEASKSQTQMFKKSGSNMLTCTLSSGLKVGPTDYPGIGQIVRMFLPFLLFENELSFCIYSPTNFWLHDKQIYTFLMKKIGNPSTALLVVLKHSMRTLVHKFTKTCRALCQLDRKSTRLNSSHSGESRMPSSA